MNKRQSKSDFYNRSRRIKKGKKNAPLRRHNEDIGVRVTDSRCNNGRKPLSKFERGREQAWLGGRTVTIISRTDTDSKGDARA